MSKTKLPSASSRSLLYRSIATVVFAVSAFSGANAQTVEKTQANDEIHTQTGPFLQANSTGSVLWTSSPRTGPLHFDGSLALYTADYFRGRYGGVPTDLDRLSYRLGLGATLELLQPGESAGPIDAFSVSFGLVNALTDTPVPNEDDWYTSDRYVGISAATDSGVLAGLTFTSYRNPRSGAGVPREIAFALRYVGDHSLGSLQPQLKVAQTVGTGTGHIVELSVTPSFQPLQSTPLTLAMPIAVGAGFNGYYGRDVDEGYFIEYGLVGSLPLNIGGTGRWTLSAGTFLTLRSDAIVEVAPVYDDAGSLATVGFVGLSFTF